MTLKVVGVETRPHHSWHLLWNHLERGLPAGEEPSSQCGIPGVYELIHARGPTSLLEEHLFESMRQSRDVQNGDRHVDFSHLIKRSSRKWHEAHLERRTKPREQTEATPQLVTGRDNRHASPWWNLDSSSWNNWFRYYLLVDGVDFLLHGPSAGPPDRPKAHHGIAHRRSPIGRRGRPYRGSDNSSGNPVVGRSSTQAAVRGSEHLGSMDSDRCPWLRHAP
ncbi:hypothetical protein MEBOL_003070 [Melittangium boletus DSM 14713]|uniref:Uncharacterized protein n=1 Tax=Melittangium boletus DSM 14713 TaxID=1294270 RepID=A0A250ICX2_9BACT|nr:hypothetical protein MEBOL_003070 [Melittangium boletus DSM 14713]